MNLIIAGDSHISALKWGTNRLARRPEHVSFRPFMSAKNGTEQFFRVSPDGTRVEASTLQGEMVFPDLQSGEHIRAYHWIVSFPFHAHRVLRRGSWRRMVPWNLKRSDWEYPLSDQAITRIIDQDSRYPIGFVVALKKIGLGVTVMTPPRLFDGLTNYDPTRQDVLFDLALRYEAHVRERLGSESIPIIAQPPETLTAEGRTKADYRRSLDDPHHGNPKYGRLMMLHILDHFEGAISAGG